MKNEHTIIMLDSVNVSHFGFLSKIGKYKNDLCFYQILMSNILDSVNQHLYVLSDDYIDIDNYFIRDNYIQQCTRYTKLHSDDKLVIASTDNILNLPKLSLDFIKNYVDLYNNDKHKNLITVKYKKIYNFNIGDKLKVNKELFKLNKGDYITVKSLNFRNNEKLIEFEEDIDNCGIHIDHLEYSMLNKLDINDDNTINAYIVVYEQLTNSYSIYKEQLHKIEKLTQAQFSTNKQLSILRDFANKLGLYDAANFIKY